MYVEWPQRLAINTGTETNKGSIMMTILWLMTILCGGSASPVAGEGGSGLDFIAGLVDSVSPLLSFFSESNEIEDDLEHGRWYHMDSVNNMGFVINAEASSACCEECNKRYNDTQFFGFSYKTFTNNASIQDCTCMNPKPGFSPQTYSKGPLTGKCGLWAYNGDGALGDGRYISGGVDILGVVTDVEDDFDSGCCVTCMEKHPATQLYEYSKENKYCKCYKTKIDQTPVAREKDYAIGTCDETPKTESPIKEDMMMNDAPVAVNNAVIDQESVAGDVGDESVAGDVGDESVAGDVGDESIAGDVGDESVAGDVGDESVAGDVGDGRTFDLDTVDWLKHVTADTSAECCEKCQAIHQDATLFVFSKSHLHCACFKPKDGVKPATANPDGWIPNPVAGVCGRF